MKTVVVIGSGNVAEALAGAIAASPYGLAQLYARNRDRGERIAARTAVRSPAIRKSWLRPTSI